MGLRNRAELRAWIGRDARSALGTDSLRLLKICDFLPRDACLCKHVPGLAGDFSQDVLEFAARVARMETLAPNLHEHEKAIGLAAFMTCTESFCMGPHA